MSMKNSNDTIGNRTRDLPACSAASNKVSNIIRRHTYEVSTYVYFTITTFFHILYVLFFLSMYIWLYSCLIM